MRLLAGPRGVEAGDLLLQGIFFSLRGGEFGLERSVFINGLLKLAAQFGAGGLGAGDRVAGLVAFAAELVQFGGRRAVNVRGRSAGPEGGEVLVLGDERGLHVRQTLVGLGELAVEPLEVGLPEVGLHLLGGQLRPEPLRVPGGIGPARRGAGGGNDGEKKQRAEGRQIHGRQGQGRQHGG